MSNKEIDSIVSDISTIKISIEKILTLLIGEDGSGLCYRVKNLEENKIDIKEMKAHYKSHDKWDASFKWTIVLFVSTSLTLAGIMLKLLKVI